MCELQLKRLVCLRQERQVCQKSTRHAEEKNRKLFGAENTFSSVYFQMVYGKNLLKRYYTVARRGAANGAQDTLSCHYLVHNADIAVL